MSEEKALELDLRLEEANQLLMMAQSPGWAVLEKEATARIAGLTKRLVWEDEEALKTKLQANIRSLEFLLTFPRQMVEAAQKATEMDAPREDGTPTP